VARSDLHGILAVPLDAVAAGVESFNMIAALVDDYDVVEIIVGLPLKMDGTEGASADMARDWANTLLDHVVVPIRFIDERLTTVQAQRGLHAAGRNIKNSRSAIDSASAVVLLQSVLDSASSKSE